MDVHLLHLYSLMAQMRLKVSSRLVAHDILGVHYMKVLFCIIWPHSSMEGQRKKEVHTASCGSTSMHKKKDEVTSVGNKTDSKTCGKSVM